MTTRVSDFAKLSTGIGISRLGSQFTLVAIPLLAVFSYDGTALTTGLLVASETVSYLIVGLPAGVLVDRWNRRRVMIVSDLARFVSLATITIWFLTAGLPLGALFVSCFVVGIATVFSDISSATFIPEVVPRSALTAATGRLEAVKTGAMSLGPAIGGLVIQLVGTIVAIAVDAISYLVSATLLATIQRTEQPTPQRLTFRGFLRELRDGVRYVLSSRLLRMVALSGSLLQIGEAMVLAVQVFFLSTVLHSTAGAIGIIVGVTAVGGFLGALAASRIAVALGVGRAMWLIPALCTPMFVIGVLVAKESVAFFVAGAFIREFGIAVAAVLQLSTRQHLVPDDLRGRMNASMRFLMRATLPLGAVLGGALGKATSPTSALFCGAVVMCVGVLPMLSAGRTADQHLKQVPQET